ncbi:hypothetical protein H257_03501 [Aphanomyces astaci]|uniref:Uncharacterized protein n=1 Tax=Aphanomyces astaci TaxID=112090 RepID=W4GX01_APHAT|nr:hypothetical protein H257_03501 [Aphanomyces astaci]ETV84240.1 hypothetical protein H257_03501 [Aphanomyces astaci]RQM24699.1 hypothetical protein B5M09_002172 [Aphanomyces astaci]|eukprot:XP_009825932.1 hypothetical protein H257_03501 [Aphanomyces astaci]
MTSALGASPADNNAGDQPIDNQQQLQSPTDDFHMLDKSLVVVTDLLLIANEDRHSDSSTLRDSIFLDDELVLTKAKLAEMQRVCTDLDFQVKQLEAAKLLWDVTRLAMDFQVIKDKDAHSRIRNRLEDELIRASHAAKFFRAEADKLQDQVVAKDTRIQELEAQVQLLQNKNDMNLRLKQLEAQVHQLTATNRTLITENHELKVHQYELQHDLQPVQRSSSWNLFNQNKATSKAKGVVLLKKSTNSPTPTKEVQPTVKSSANLELIRMLKRELDDNKQRDSIDAWY